MYRAAKFTTHAECQEQFNVSHFVRVAALSIQVSEPSFVIKVMNGPLTPPEMFG